MIKFSSRPNLKYPIQLVLWNILREYEILLINYFFGLNKLLIYTPLMFIGEILAGSIFYLYQKQFLSEREKIEPIRFMNIEYNQTERHFSRKFGIKTYFLLITSAFCDFLEFSLSLQISKFTNISISLEKILRGIVTIDNALFCYYILRLPLFKHHFFSLILIGICLVLVLITEFIFQEINIFLSYGELVLAIVFIFIIQLVNALEESIQKYLYEYNQLNPFFVLMCEGIFGFAITFFYCLFYNPFDAIIKFYNKNSKSEFGWLIFCFILYILLSGGKNTFRIVTTTCFSPMTTTFMDYVINPSYIILYFYWDMILKQKVKLIKHILQ